MFVGCILDVYWMFIGCLLDFVQSFFDRGFVFYGQKTMASRDETADKIGVFIVIRIPPASRMVKHSDLPYFRLIGVGDEYEFIWHLYDKDRRTFSRTQAEGM